MSERTDRLYAVLSAARRGALAVTGHDKADVDAAISCALLRDLCAFWKIPARIVLPTRADEQPRRVLPRFGLFPDDWRGQIAPGDALVRVDHHAPPPQGGTIAVIDHHPAANPPEAAFVLIEPCGACALTVLRLMEEAGMTPTPGQTALAVVALYMDTLALRSAKIAPAEAEWARAQAAALGLDEAWLTREGLQLADMTLPPHELLRYGEKVYDCGGARVISTSISTGEMTDALRDALLSAAREELRARGAALWVLLWRDPLAGVSTEIDVTPDGGTAVFRYDRLVSRGRDVMPRVERMLLKGE